MLVNVWLLCFVFVSTWYLTLHSFDLDWFVLLPYNSRPNVALLLSALIITKKFLLFLDILKAKLSFLP